MAATIMEIADAVVSTLNGAALSQTFTAERRYAPVYAKQDEDGLDELADLQVCVMARELAMALLTRGKTDTDYRIDVGVFRRIGQAPMTEAERNAACDPLMLLVQEIAALFLGKRPDDYPTALCVAVANEPIYDPAKVDQENLFASLLTLTFRKDADQ